MKKIIVLIGLFLITTETFATYILVLTEKKVGTYKNGKILSENNPNLSVFRIQINEATQAALLLEQSNPFDKNKIITLKEEYLISYVYTGYPPGTNTYKTICLTGKALLATETIIINPNTFQFINVFGDKITISEGVVQKLDETVK